TADLPVVDSPAGADPEPGRIGQAAQKRAGALAQSAKLGLDREHGAIAVIHRLLRRDYGWRELVDIRVVLRRHQVEHREDPALLLAHGDQQLLDARLAAQ